MNVVNVPMSNMPLVSRLMAANADARFHMPGHGGRLPDWLGAAFDTTELPSTDDPHEPGEAITSMQALMAERARSVATLALASGATAGVQAMVFSCVPRGGRLILSRASHISAWNACALRDVDVVCAQPSLEDGWAATSAQAYIEAIRKTPDADAVLVTAPDYVGLTPDITAIAAEAKRLGMLLLVDSAHGAHRPWMAERDAIAACADMWVHSAHKTLPALTGAAWLHIADAARVEMARRALRLLTTTSPSFLILASLDYARAWMDAKGEQAMAFLARQLDETTRHALRIGWETQECTFAFTRDDLRLRLRPPRHLSGIDAARVLAEGGVSVEMATRDFVLLLPPMTSHSDDFKRLRDAISLVDARTSASKRAFESVVQPKPPPRVLRISEAVFGEIELVRTEDATGRVCAGCVGLYPPGVPALLPGECVTREVVEMLLYAVSHGCASFGLSGGGMLPVVKR